MMSINKLFVFLLLGFLLFGCKAAKDVYNENVEIKNISDSRLIKSVESNYLNYSTLYVKKYNADVTVNGSRKSFSGSLFIDRDSQVIMTVAPLLGIELFRAKLAKDSVILIDRIKKHVYYGSYDFVEKNIYLDVNFHLLQAILTNEFFIINDNAGQEVSLKRFKHYIIDNQYSFNSVKQNRINRNGRVSSVLQNFLILPDVFKITQSYIQDTENQSSMTIKYSEIFKVGTVWFPSKLDINGNRGSQIFEFSISFNSVAIDSDNKLNFHIPENYIQSIVK